MKHERLRAPSVNPEHYKENRWSCLMHGWLGIDHGDKCEDCAKGKKATMNIATIIEQADYYDKLNSHYRKV